MFKSINSMISQALSKTSDHNEVKEVSCDNYRSWPVSRREDCLLLYGPYLSDKSASGVISFKSKSVDEDSVKNENCDSVVA